MVTAIPHPKVITIQPEFWAFLGQENGGDDAVAEQDQNGRADKLRYEVVVHVQAFLPSLRRSHEAGGEPGTAACRGLGGPG